MSKTVGWGAKDAQPFEDRWVGLRLAVAALLASSKDRRALVVFDAAMAVVAVPEHEQAPFAGLYAGRIIVREAGFAVDTQTLTLFDEVRLLGGGVSAAEAIERAVNAQVLVPVVQQEWARLMQAVIELHGLRVH